MQASVTIIWHYTVKEHLDSILRDHLIKPATVLVRRGQKPVVWFSSNPNWEETAKKVAVSPDGTMQFGSQATTHELGGGLARIGVSPETAPHDWNAFKRLSGISSKAAQSLYQAAIDIGSRTGQWFASFELVAEQRWVTVELWDGSKWNPLPAWSPSNHLAGKVS